MTGPGYFEHSIYLQYFKGLRNVRIVPQEKHDQGAERKYVHYPLAREIALGALSQFRGFESFEAERVLVLNNFRIKVPKDGQSKIRPWNKKNPDIVTLTADGEVTVVECKIKANFPKDDVDRMAKTYITIQDFAGPLPLHDGNSLINNNLDKWRYIYKSCYKSRFPSLRNSFEELFLLKNYEAIRKWADQSMKHIKSNRFRYIVAYSGEAVSYSIHALCKKFQSTINTYDSSMSNLSENLLFLSISKEGEIHYLKSISDF